MYQGKKQKFDWTFALLVGDVLSLLLAFPVTWGIVVLLPDAYASSMDAPHWPACFAYAAVVLYVLKETELYTWQAFTHPFMILPRLILALLIGATVFLTFRFLFGGKSPDYLWGWILLYTLLAGISLWSMRLTLKYCLMEVWKVVPVEKIAFLGWSNRLERVLGAMVREMGKFQQVAGFFYDLPRPELDPAYQKNYIPLGNFKEIEEALQREKISLLIVDESSISSTQLQKLGEICARCIVSLKIIPNSFDIWSTRLSLRVVAGIPLLGIYDLRYDRFHNRLAKRALDICGALVGLLLSAPIIAILAILIKRESPGPIFFRQTRLGLYGKPFQIIKLRSMRLDAEKESGAVWAVEDDPRRLKIGEFMRARNLDELPQFWNVLMGEMSMVGPRPERPEFVEGFKETVLYYNLRHSCKPGVTGWAAVHGLRGNTSLEDRLEYDLFYIENWSIWLDIRIILMTLAPPKNAY